MPTVEDFIVDFSQEQESGGGAPHFEPGAHKVRIVAAKTGMSEDKSTPYLEVTFAFLEGKYRKGKKKISERLYNTPKAMRRFRFLLNAVDIKVPGKLNLVKLIPKLKGKDLYIELEDDERDGYPVRSRVGFEGFTSLEDYSPDGDEDEVDEDEEEDIEEEEEDEDIEDEEEDELEDEEEEEPAPRKRSKKSKPKATKKSKAADDEEEDDLDELDLDAM